MKIQDGSGKGYEAKVDSNNRVHAKSVTISGSLDSIQNGQGFTINTGSITYTAAGTMLYIKNDSDQDLVLQSLIFGLGQATTSDSPEMTIVRGPTGGDLITDQTEADMVQNRNFGSSELLNAETYKGKSGGTLTGGEDMGIVYLNTSARSVIPVDFILPKGASVAVKLDPKLSSGSMKAYCAAIVYLRGE